MRGAAEYDDEGVPLPCWRTFVVYLHGQNPITIQAGTWEGDGDSLTFLDMEERPVLYVWRAHLQAILPGPPSPIPRPGTPTATRSGG